MYQVNVRIIRALATHIAPKEEIRFYLVGVLVEFAPDAIYYVATDGARLAAFRQDYQDFEEPPAETLQVIVPRSTAVALKPRKAGGVDAVCTLGRADDNELHWIIKCPIADDIGVIAIDAKYPNWRLVVPKHRPKEIAFNDFNFNHLGSLWNCVHDALEIKWPVVRIYPDGKNPALVLLDHPDHQPRFVGVATAYREKQLSDMDAPDWVAQLAAPAKPKKKQRAAPPAPASQPQPEAIADLL